MYILIRKSFDTFITYDICNFFDNLYQGFNIERINAKRMINCQADKRGSVTEIVVRNYKRSN